MKKNVLIAVGIGVLAYFLLRTKTIRQPINVPPQYYDAPPRGTAAFQNWVNTLLQVYGQSKWLFEPGGPFYKNKITNPEELNKVLNQPIIDIPAGGQNSNWG